MPRQVRFEYSLRMTRNNPMPGACADGRRGGFAAHRLRAARDQIDAQLGSGAGRFERLAEVQQRVGAHERVAAAISAGASSSQR